ncbi:MAG: hypothetical protein ACFCD0_21575 [Gemmataceae bacterium]
MTFGIPNSGEPTRRILKALKGPVDELADAIAKGTIEEEIDNLARTVVNKASQVNNNE